MRASAAARTELNRLRGAIAAATRSDQLPGAPTGSTDHRAATDRELLGSCAAELQEVARAADGHASDVRTLMESWPR